MKVAARRPRRSSTSRLQPEPVSQPQILVWMLRAALLTGADRRIDWTDAALAGARLEALEEREFSGRAVRERMLRAALHRAEKQLAAAPREDALLANVELLGEPLGLEREERLMLALAAATAVCLPLTFCFDNDDGRSLRARMHILGQVLGISEAKARYALRSDGPLARLGLVRMGGTRRGEWFVLRDNLEALLLQDHASPEALLTHFARLAPAAELSLSDWPYLSADLELVLGAVRGALEGKVRGFHLLLYGIPGTGKTQLTRAIAAELAGSLFDVGVEDDDHDPLGRGGRLSNYWICQHYGARLPRALVVFDEMEDVFDSDDGPFSRSSSSKGFTNRMLEETPIPTIWCSNRVAGLDEAFLRRFDLALQIPAPPKAVRRQILERHLAQLRVGDALLERIAATAAVTPADCERAARAVRLAGLESGAAAERALQRVLELRLEVRGRTPPKKPQDDRLAVYGLRYVNADQDPAALLEGLRASGRGTALFHGPPGTGKSAFAAHLAQKLGRPLLVRYGSDLLDKYVGETEKAIAAMFEEAKAQEAVLFLDEADSFLGARAAARHAWEVSHTNELLVRMEQFDGLFLCATNRLEALDPACLRRFAIKVGFRPLTAAQSLELFAATLAAAGQPALAEGEVRLAEATLSRLPGLAPGDFAAVWRKARMLGGALTTQALLAGLEAETAVRSERRSIGF